MTIQEYFGDWSDIIDLREADRIMKKLSVSKQLICPQTKDIFKAFKLCPLKTLKVVIIGQDPYPNLRLLSNTDSITRTPVATGLAFANASDTPINSYSSSLIILRESVIDFTLPHGIINFDPSLETWEEQGVLLLNAALSCEVGKPESHMMLWRPFMKSFLHKLSVCCPGTVYVLMGNVAQTLEPYINQKFNTVIRCRHPAYYARTLTKMPTDIWKQINQIIEGQTGETIKWYEEIN